MVVPARVIIPTVLWNVKSARTLLEHGRAHPVHLVAEHEHRSHAAAAAAAAAAASRLGIASSNGRTLRLGDWTAKAQLVEARVRHRTAGRTHRRRRVALHRGLGRRWHCGQHLDLRIASTGSIVR